MITNIENDRELRCVYEILGMLAERTTSNVQERVARIKKAIRKYRDRPVSHEQIVRSDCDSLLVVFPLDKDLKTAEEADDYFLDHYYREFIPSMYDCTGQVFTTWYKIFRRRGQFWVYNATAIDV